MNDMNLIGKIFGKLTVIGMVRPNVWECKCECGKTCIKHTSRILPGHHKSCGCSMGMQKHGSAKRNGRTVEYQTWININHRCIDSENSLYGGRGIKVCDRWVESFENFLSDMGTRPSPNHSIERIENSGDYEPGNCKWATPVEQAANRRTNINIEYKGEVLIVAEWARRFGMSKSGIKFHLKKGRTIGEIIKLRNIGYPAINYSFGFIS